MVSTLTRQDRSVYTLPWRGHSNKAGQKCGYTSLVRALVQGRTEVWIHSLVRALLPGRTEVWIHFLGEGTLTRQDRSVDTLPW